MTPYEQVITDKTEASQAPKLDDLLDMYAPAGSAPAQPSMNDLLQMYAPETPTGTAAPTPDASAPNPQSSGDTIPAAIERATNAPFAGFMDAFANTALGGAQAVAQGAHKVGIMSDDTYTPINEGIKEIKKMKDDANSEEYAGSPISKGLNVLGNLAGNIAQFSALGGGTGYGSSMLAGAATGAAQPTDQDTTKIFGYDLPTRGVNAGVSSAAAGIGQGIGNALSTKVDDPNLQNVMQTAADNDIPVYRNQTSDSRFMKAMAAVLKNVPGGGGGSAAEEQVGSFQKALTASVGVPDEDVMNSTTLGKAAEKMADTYNAVKKNPLVTSPQFENDVMSLIGDAHQNLAEGLPQRAVFDQQATNLMNNIQNGSMTGAQAKNLVSNIGAQARGVNGSPQLAELRSVINDQWASSMPPDDAAALRLTDQHWRNMLALEGAVGRNPNGPISPTAIQGGVKNVFGNYARGGDSNLENLSRLGQLVGKSFPDSGTATNEKILDALKHIGATTLVAGGGGLAADREQEGSVGSRALRDLAGAGGAIAAARFGIAPYVFSNMSAAPSAIQGVAPGALTALVNMVQQRQSPDQQGNQAPQ